MEKQKEKEALETVKEKLETWSLVAVIAETALNDAPNAEDNAFSEFCLREYLKKCDNMSKFKTDLQEVLFVTAAKAGYTQLQAMEIVGKLLPMIVSKHTQQKRGA